ncbi:hypothetical protein OG384_13770 [Streptomyces sp. NBC_01324]|uniref:hypothetical protein n=1 Tax=Streptomyces sp. NBC_01324 TaxID=2903826 RepID=UPI002E0DCC80|nr:hypothetical protein OG384_13770 [Streptomyces sp. NBC_01324]
MRRTLAGLNVAMAAGSAVAAVIAVARPTLLLPAGTEPTTGLQVYAQAYAVRAVPLAAALVYALKGERRALVPVLAVAGAAQAGDAYIGVSRGVTGMAVGGTLAAATHLGTAWWLIRRTGAPAPGGAA